jgi:hypothetical protein
MLLRGKVCAYLTCRLMGDPNAGALEKQVTTILRCLIRAKL